MSSASGNELLSPSSLELKVKQKLEQIASLERVIAENCSIDVVFCVDCTKTMAPYIRQTSAFITQFAVLLKSLNANIQCRVGFVGYRDHCDINHRFERFPFSTDLEAFTHFVSTIKDAGGGDLPEDVLGGLNIVQQEFIYTAKCRLLLHIADAPCHGTQYHSEMFVPPDTTLSSSSAAAAVVEAVDASSGAGTKTTTPLQQQQPKRVRIKDDYPQGCPLGLTPLQILPLLRMNRVKYFFIKINDSTDQMIQQFNRESFPREGPEYSYIITIPLVPKNMDSSKVSGRYSTVFSQEVDRRQHAKTLSALQPAIRSPKPKVHLKYDNNNNSNSNSNNSNSNSNSNNSISSSTSTTSPHGITTTATTVITSSRLDSRSLPNAATNNYLAAIIYQHLLKELLASYSTSWRAKEGQSAAAVSTAGTATATAIATATTTSTGATATGSNCCIAMTVAGKREIGSKNSNTASTERERRRREAANARGKTDDDDCGSSSDGAACNPSPSPPPSPSLAHSPSPPSIALTTGSSVQHTASLLGRVFTSRSDDLKGGFSGKGEYSSGGGSSVGVSVNCTETETRHQQKQQHQQKQKQQLELESALAYVEQYFHPSAYWEALNRDGKAGAGSSNSDSNNSDSSHSGALLLKNMHKLRSIPVRQLVLPHIRSLFELLLGKDVGVHDLYVKGDSSSNSRGGGGGGGAGSIKGKSSISSSYNNINNRISDKGRKLKDRYKHKVKCLSSVHAPFGHGSTRTAYYALSKESKSGFTEKFSFSTTVVVHKIVVEGNKIHNASNDTTSSSNGGTGTGRSRDGDGNSSGFDQRTTTDDTVKDDDNTNDDLVVIVTDREMKSVVPAIDPYIPDLQCLRAAVYLAAEFNRVTARLRVQQLDQGETFGQGRCAPLLFPYIEFNPACLVEYIPPPTSSAVLQTAQLPPAQYCHQEPFLDGIFEKFNSNSGYVLPSPSPDSHCRHEVLQAFSHWTHTQTHGLMMVVDLQGVYISAGAAGGRFVLTDPAIHCEASADTAYNLRVLYMDQYQKEKEKRPQHKNKTKGLSGTTTTTTTTTDATAVCATADSVNINNLSDMSNISSHVLRFGSTNHGIAGFERFYNTHKCNIYCRHLGIELQRSPPPSQLQPESSYTSGNSAEVATAAATAAILTPHRCRIPDPATSVQHADDKQSKQQQQQQQCKVM